MIDTSIRINWIWIDKYHVSKHPIKNVNILFNSSSFSYMFHVHSNIYYLHSSIIVWIMTSFECTTFKATNLHLIVTFKYIENSDIICCYVTQYIKQGCWGCNLCNLKLLTNAIVIYNTKKAVYYRTIY